MNNTPHRCMRCNRFCKRPAGLTICRRCYNAKQRHTKHLLAIITTLKGATAAQIKAYAVQQRYHFPPLLVDRALTALVAEGKLRAIDWGGQQRYFTVQQWRSVVREELPSGWQLARFEKAWREVA